MDDILLIGGGGHARSCIDVIENENIYKIAGFIEHNKSTCNKIFNYPIIGVDKDLEKLRSEFTYALVVIGQIKNYRRRERLFSLLKSKKYKIPIIKSPTAYVSKHSKILEGTIIMHDAVVNAGVRIGANCIINTKALIEHDSTIGSHSHVSTGAIINGEVNVGEGTFIGSGTVIKQLINIGNGCVIDAGCYVKENVKDNKALRS